MRTNIHLCCTNLSSEITGIFSLSCPLCRQLCQKYLWVQFRRIQRRTIPGYWWFQFFLIKWNNLTEIIPKIKLKHDRKRQCTARVAMLAHFQSIKTILCHEHVTSNDLFFLSTLSYRFDMGIVKAKFTWPLDWKCVLRLGTSAMDIKVSKKCNESSM